MLARIKGRAASSQAAAGMSAEIQPVTQINNNNDEIEELKKEIYILKGVTSAMPDPYYIRDWDYNIISWPESIAKLTGYSEAEAKKLKCYQMFRACVCPPDNECPTQQCVQNHSFLHDAAVDVYRKDGSIIHTLVSNAGVYDERGVPVGAVEVVKKDHVKELQKFVEVTIQKLDQRMNDILQEGMGKTRESMRSSHAGMELLQEKSKAIIDVVGIMEEISTRTKLLSLNALIEAAHAGEIGKSFNVVASEVKRLSESSDQSAQRIKETTNEIIVNIDSVTGALDNAVKELLASLDDLAKRLDSQMEGVANELNNKFENLKTSNMG